ncbi:MAG: recombinase family protein [Dokdonella sp.]|nr:recombinase family protein [Dokdonella sp.]
MSAWVETSKNKSKNMPANAGHARLLLPEHPMRCVIYTRKSADETDPQLSSLQVQRELCTAYIASQAFEGWYLLPEHYDDGGYSGGTLKRPALQALLTQVQERAVDTIVIYKIDRLSRSLRDFLNLVSMFEAHDVTFVSVTQSFNTATSIGKLILNILLSFAQFERELTGERLRDWFAGARQRGLWMHGRRPFGYQVERGCLSVDETEAGIIRYAHRRYAAIGSARLLANEMNRKGFRNQYGRPLTRAGVTRLLRSRLYCGDLVHRGQPHPGRHQAIISEKTWRSTQKIMAESGRRRSAKNPYPFISVLQGLIFNETGRALIHVRVPRNNALYRYYVPRIDRYGEGTTCQDRYRAKPLEDALIALIDRITGMSLESQSQHDRAEYLRGIVRRVTVYPDEIEMTLFKGVVVRTPHEAKLKPQKKPRDTPAWLPQARKLRKKGHSKAETARLLQVPYMQFWRASVKYGF